MKKVLIISTSLRGNANSEILAHETEQGAKDVGHEVEFISLKGKEIKFCKGCLACQKLGKCVIKDDAIEITEKMKEADVIVWATPIYYYEMSGQMKTLIDRANSLFATGKNFTDLVQEKRMSQAAWLLTNTSQNVSDIAIAVGYENISYFHRLFAARYGKSPRLYRKTALGE